VEPVSRRSFFKQAGAAAAVAGTIVAAPLSITGAIASAVSPDERALTPKEDLRHNEELVAHVKNSRSGEISLFLGHREVTIRDRKIAARLVRAAR